MDPSDETVLLSDLEPQITSSDPNERKLARKLRIERRLEAIRRQCLPQGEEEEVEEKTLFQQQAQRSIEVLEKLLIEGDELVTNVRVANEAREVDRREEEGLNRERIIEELEEEAEDAKQKFDEIADKWTDILKYNDPLAINDEIIEQKAKCDELIRQKDGIILMLKDELKQAEIKFTRDQRKQKDDINTLAQRIEKQLVIMGHAYREQLQLQEQATLAERKILMEANDKKWEDLFKKRSLKEEENCAKKFKQIDEFVDVMTKLRKEFQERFREAKIKLENDIEMLQQELEKAKAVCLINSEKLDYNYQILKKREDENIIIKSQQKRRLNKLQDIINELRNKIRSYEDQSNAEIEKLTQQIKKMHADILKIEEKADHFMESNETKFQQVWDLNKATADKLMGQILKVDKAIYEQQLGLQWEPPEVKVKDKTEIPSYRTAADALAEAAARSKKEHPKEDATATTLTGESAAVEESASFKKLMRKVLKQVSDKTGFFVEERLKEILKPYREEDQTLVRLDNVFAALQVKDKDDIRILMDFILPYTHCPICTKVQKEYAETERADTIQVSTFISGSSVDALSLTDVTDLVNAAQQSERVINDVLDYVAQEGSSLDMSVSTGEVEEEEEEEELEEEAEVRSAGSVGVSVHDALKERAFCEKNHPLVISSVYILKALKEFVSNVHKPRKGPITTTNRLANRRDTISRLMPLEDIETYWSKYLEVFSPMRLKTWDGLYHGLKKYHVVLTNRQKVNDEVVKLRRQNMELKQILANYLEKKTKTPPCGRGTLSSGKSSPPGSSNRKL